MKTVITFAVLSAVAACSATPELPPQTPAIRDYVEVGELPQAERIRTNRQDSWAPLGDRHAIYRSRDGAYLLEFQRVCREFFDHTTITPDRRRDHNVMRVGIDTLRGCRIDKMYPVTEAQAEELRRLAREPVDGTQGP